MKENCMFITCLWRLIQIGMDLNIKRKKIFSNTLINFRCTDLNRNFFIETDALKKENNNDVGGIKLL